jgi:hypothetical protein
VTVVLAEELEELDDEVEDVVVLSVLLVGVDVGLLSSAVGLPSSPMCTVGSPGGGMISNGSGPILGWGISMPPGILMLGILIMPQNSPVHPLFPDETGHTGRITGLGSSDIFVVMAAKVDDDNEVRLVE